VTCCGAFVRERSFTPYQNRSYLSHSLPVVEPPIDGLVVLNPRRGYFLLVDTFCVAPNVDRGSCTVPNPVGGIATSGQGKHLIFVLRPVAKHRQGEFDKSGADVQVQTLSGRDGEVCSTSVLVTGNLIWVSQHGSMCDVESLPWSRTSMGR